MKKIFSIVAYLAVTISLLFSSCSTSQKTAVDKVQKTEAKTQYTQWENALGWKIEGMNLATPSYVFGTMHIIPSGDFFLPAGFDQAFDYVDKITFEIDMNEMSDFGALMGMFSQAFMNDNKTLADLMSPDEYDLVVNHFEKMGLPLMFMDKIKPMFLTIFASPDFSSQDLQNGSMLSYEAEFFERAQKDAKEVSGLESLEYQMSIFDSIPYDAQADMLLETIRSGQGESDQLDKTLKLYKQQNIEALFNLMEDEESGLGEFNDVLLNNRNHEWIPKMETGMAEQSTLFAVGAGHLAGEHGVLHLLKKRGYQVSPLRQEL